MITGNKYLDSGIIKGKIAMMTYVFRQLSQTKQILANDEKYLFEGIVKYLKGDLYGAKLNFELATQHNQNNYSAWYNLMIINIEISKNAYREGNDKNFEKKVISEISENFEALVTLDLNKVRKILEGSICIFTNNSFESQLNNRKEIN